MKSVMSHNFSQIPRANIQRSSFDRSHGHKTIFNAGFLIPILTDEALPGDTFNLSMSAFARLATPIKPLMDNMFLETFFFAVPNRLLWDNWQKFNGEQRNPDDSTDFLVPTLTTFTNPSGGGLFDHFGFPVLKQIKNANSLHARAYNLIYNEWFRDQNLQDSVPSPTDDGPDTFTDFQLKKRGKRHDYFTSCLPWPQKGDPVQIPLGGTIPITGSIAVTGNGAPTFDGSVQATNHPLYGGLYDEDDFEYRLEGHAQTGDTLTDNTQIGKLSWNSPNLTATPNLTGDLSQSTTATINALREAFQIQKLYERDARGGTRYTEIIKSHFGVSSPDSRLQRPEYLGGGSTMINISAVAQTTATDGGTPQANLAATGTASMHNHAFTKSFTEHCVIIGLACVRADLTYQQGLDRMFSRSTRFDYYWPALSHIGEQEVLNKEIFLQGTDADDEIFGYQERYGEYRYKPSIITGEFRSVIPIPLDVWHLSQEFGNLPTLNNDFISENPLIGRVIAVPSEPHFLFDSYFAYKCARPMPAYSVPGLIDHF